MARIAVIGAGIGGLGVALCAGRSGHEVVLVERDDTPLPADPHGAFDWDRRGAPQVRHSHALLARLRNLLRDRHPDVLAAVLDAGATELDFIAMLPEEMDRTPLPGDEDLVALACRRTTFEWVLRRCALDGERVELRHGVSVDSLLVGAAAGGAPLVTGVRLSDGSALEADVVVDAGGRRSPGRALLADAGIDVPEQVEDTGIVYFSRFFRLLEGRSHPPQLGPIGGDLGYLKFGVFPGDDRSFSITLAARADDDDLRRLLLDEDAFLAIARRLPSTVAHVEPDRSAPITGVHVMARLLNRRRWFLDDAGEPLVRGFHAVGDAHTCTNPLYGRGCSLAMVQAQSLVDRLDEHGEDHLARSVAYEADAAEQVLPWYRAAVAQDRMAREGGAGSAQELLRDGLLPALRIDPVVLRAFLRMMNLLSPPESLMADPDVVGRVLSVHASRHERPPPDPLGPTRDELLDAVA
jgi:2-polyprenyl-6-methoxyphenol hydroxylase-like FAD-dependent oxidoreductase